MRWVTRQDVLDSVIKLVKPKAFAEQGTSTGETALYIAKNNPDVKVYTCDIFERRTDLMKQAFTEYKVEFDLCCSGAMHKQFGGHGITAEVVFQDADHGYQSVISDLESFVECARVFVIDDMICPYCTKEQNPPRLGALDFTKKHDKPIWLMDVGCGIGIIVMDPSLYEPIAKMVNAAEKVEKDFSNSIPLMEEAGLVKK